jgi:hypothetical protein
MRNLNSTMLRSFATKAQDDRRMIVPALSPSTRSRRWSPFFVILFLVILFFVILNEVKNLDCSRLRSFATKAQDDRRMIVPASSPST